MDRRKKNSLILSAILLIACICLTFVGKRQVRASDYDVKLIASDKMQACMDRIHGYKEEMGLSISDEDWFDTGMIGEEWTPITTTSAPAQAKRTTANADMAALVVELLTEAGVKAHDTIGAGFSGSFPSLNLAVICACSAMDVNLIYITSVGSSMYGANQPELTFPDMVQKLAQDGLVDTLPVLNTLGGQRDCGLDMEEAVREEIITRLKGYSTGLLMEEDFLTNIRTRMQIYEEMGPIVCFIGVGGNITTSGTNDTDLGWGVISPYTIQNVNDRSGLIERYNAEGLPCVYLLNVRRLVSDYDLPYDPESLPAPGESAIYYETVYPVYFAVLGIIASFALLIWGFRRKHI